MSKKLNEDVLVGMGMLVSAQHRIFHFGSVGTTRWIP